MGVAWKILSVFSKNACTLVLLKLTFLTCNWFLGTNWLLKRKMSALHIWKSFLRNSSSLVTEARAGINPSSSPWLSNWFSSVSPTGSYLAASLLQSPPWKSHDNLLGIVVPCTASKRLRLEKKKAKQNELKQFEKFQGFCTVLIFNPFLKQASL